MAARKLGAFTWEEDRIMVVADYSKSEKRVKFNKYKKLLHNKHIRFSLICPAVLVMKAP